MERTAKKVIDEAIKNADTYEDCIALIRANGYEVKGELLDGTDPSGQAAGRPIASEDNSDNPAAAPAKGKNYKYISFRPLDGDRFVRGSAKSLGADYTKERIRERINERLARERQKQSRQPQKHAGFPTRKRTIVKDYSKRDLIDTTAGKFTGSPGLKHWADLENLKTAAAHYSQAGSMAELERQISAKLTLAKTARQSLVDTEHQLRELGQILKYAEQYGDNHIYHVRYQKSKDQDAYFRRHEMQLILHDGAENMLKRSGINPKTLDVERLRGEYHALYAKKEALQEDCRSADREAADLGRRLAGLRQYLGHGPAGRDRGRDDEREADDRNTEKSRKSL